MPFSRNLQMQSKASSVRVGLVGLAISPWGQIRALMLHSRSSSEGYSGRIVLDLRGIPDKSSLVLHSPGSFPSFNEGTIFSQILQAFSASKYEDTGYPYPRFKAGMLIDHNRGFSLFRTAKSSNQHWSLFFYWGFW